MILKAACVLVLVHIGLTWAIAIYRGRQARRRNANAPEGASFQPPVSILVPAWRERGMLEQCIQALQKITYPDWEAIVLAGGPDGTYEAALQATAGDGRFRVLERGPEPKNVALARGVEAARNDILALLDADCVVEPGWLSALVAPLARGAPVSLGDSRPSRETWVSLADLMQYTQMYEITGNLWIQGDRSLAVRSEALVKIGGLPSHTYAREDWDLGVKWAQAGVKVAFAPGACLRTQWPATLQEFWKREVRWRRTHLAGLWEHRAFARRNPVWFFYQFFFYGLSALLSLALVASLLAAIAWPATRLTVAGAIVLALIWLGGRRAALGAEVAAFTGDIAWIGRAWALVVLLFVTFPAAVVAMLSAWQGTPFDYKGPRKPVSI